MIESKKFCEDCKFYSANRLDTNYSFSDNGYCSPKYSTKYRSLFYDIKQDHIYKSKLIFNLKSYFKYLKEKNLVKKEKEICFLNLNYDCDFYEECDKEIK